MTIAVDQVAGLGFDGLRFDFSNEIHRPGSGDHDGWKMLQAITLRLKYFYPKVALFAEEFPPHPIITTTVAEGGLGFHGMWNTEFQHRLIYEHHRQSVLEAVVKGSIPPLKRLAQHILDGAEFGDACYSVTVLSNHDEVGNAKRLVNIVEAHPRGFDCLRAVSALALLMPGYPILFQGTEDASSNYFSWGLPHTWGDETHWKGRLSDRQRRGQLAIICDALRLRAENPSLQNKAPLQLLSCSDKDRFLVFSRDNFVIALNLSEKAALVGPWLGKRAQLRFSTERRRYGYRGTSTRGSRLASFALKVWEQCSP